MNAINNDNCFELEISSKNYSQRDTFEKHFKSRHDRKRPYIFFKISDYCCFGKRNLRAHIGSVHERKTF